MRSDASKTSSNKRLYRRIIAGMDEAAFQNDRKTRDAVERCIERVIEATTKLDEDTKALLGDRPWKDLRGMGNWLRHGYDKVAPDIVWDVASNKVPRLEGNPWGSRAGVTASAAEAVPCACPPAILSLQANDVEPGKAIAELKKLMAWRRVWHHLRRRRRLDSRAKSSPVCSKSSRSPPRQSWDRLPAQFREGLDNVTLSIADFADAETLDAMRIRDPLDLLGLYQGAGLPSKSVWDPVSLPDRIFLYRIPIIDYARRDDHPVPHFEIARIGVCGRHVRTNAFHAAIVLESGRRERKVTLERSWASASCPVKSKRRDEVSMRERIVIRADCNRLTGQIRSPDRIASARNRPTILLHEN